MSVAYWIDGCSSDCLSPGTRLLQYGDGLFETLCVQDGLPAYLDRHLQRLQAGSARLRLGFDGWDQLETELRDRARDYGEGVLKVILGRGVGGRGYRYAPEQAVMRIVSTQPLPDTPAAPAEQGVRVRLCDLRLASQPSLAGIKHLNRLEQVLARAEWQQEYAEGLLRDCNDRLIEGTMSNLFLVRNGRLLTPRLDRCGVAGVMRSVLFDLAAAAGIEWERCALTVSDLADASELFLCNSLIGVWPVISVDDRFEYNVGPVTRALQAALSQDDKRRTGLWYND